MKTSRLLLAVAALSLAGAAHAQFVKGNEAVQIRPDGQRRVETPPTAGALLAKPCPADNPACTSSGWKMVETAAGLQECTEAYARPTTCRPSTYGTQKLPRVWVVKTGTQWQHCSRPEIGTGCVALRGLPSPQVQ